MEGLFGLLSTVLDVFAIGGGGGSGGGGGGSGGSGGGGSSNVFVLYFKIGSIIVLFIIASILGVQAAKRLKERRAKMKLALQVAASADKIWELGTIETHAKDTFVQYQKDWSLFNLDSMKTYMTPEYYQHNLLMMGALKQVNRQNDVQNPVVISSEVYEMRDSEDDTVDAHTMRMTVAVQDVLKDLKENVVIFQQPLSVTEYYKFKRHENVWLFDGIDQATANPAMRNPGLEAFSRQEGYFYSLDWGHLLLPRRGQLFSRGAFGQSDINNHVIGLYNNIIIQLYTYVERPRQSTRSYLIAQTAIPKSYGNIVVRRNKGIFGGGISGLEKIKMEWNDFNIKYEVFATAPELATSFELLNPKFMEQLQALPFEVNIEVVDNIIYLYAPEQIVVSSSNYATMLEILKAAFKEMKM